MKKRMRILVALLTAAVLTVNIPITTHAETGDGSGTGIVTETDTDTDTDKQIVGGTEDTVKPDTDTGDQDGNKDKTDDIVTDDTDKKDDDAVTDDTDKKDDDVVTDDTDKKDDDTVADDTDKKDNDAVTDDTDKKDDDAVADDTDKANGIIDEDDVVLPVPAKSPAKAPQKNEDDAENTDISSAVQAFLDAVAAIKIPEEINDETGPALHDQIGKAQEAYDKLTEEDLALEVVREAAAHMQEAIHALTGGIDVVDGEDNDDTNNKVEMNGQEYATITDALVDAEPRVTATIVLKGNLAENVTIASDKDIVLDLNGYTLTSVGNADTITNNGTLEIRDSSEEKTGTVDNTGNWYVSGGVGADFEYGATIRNNVGATAILSGGNYTRSKENSTVGNINGNSCYVIHNKGDMTIESGVAVYNDNGRYSSLIENGWYNKDKDYNISGEYSKLTINGGKFRGGRYNVKNDEYGILSIKGGDFDSPAADSSWNILNYNEATISGGNFNISRGWNVYAGMDKDFERTDGKLTITGGKFTTLHSATYCLQVGTDTDLIEVTGGTYNNSENSDNWRVSDSGGHDTNSTDVKIIPETHTKIAVGTDDEGEYIFKVVPVVKKDKAIDLELMLGEEGKNLNNWKKARVQDFYSGESTFVNNDRNTDVTLETIPTSEFVTVKYNDEAPREVIITPKKVTTEDLLFTLEYAGADNDVDGKVNPDKYVIEPLNVRVVAGSITVKLSPETEEEDYTYRITKEGSDEPLVKNGRLIHGGEVTEQVPAGKYTVTVYDKNGNSVAETAYEVTVTDKDGKETTDTVKAETADTTLNIDRRTALFVVSIPKEKTNISVKKVWEDAGNQDGIRPAEVKVELFADGEKTDKVLSLNEKNGWKDSFTDLVKKANGKNIEYTVKEADVNGYKASITGNAEDGYVITNTHAPEKTSISVEKKWDDGNNKDKLRPAKVEVKLLADGKEIKSLILDEDSSWKVTVNDLDKYANGKEILYSVKEESVKEYTGEVKGNAVTGFIITNTHTPKSDEPTKPDTPDTSDEPAEPVTPDEPHRPTNSDTPGISHESSAPAVSQSTTVPQADAIAAPEQNSGVTGGTVQGAGTGDNSFSAVAVYAVLVLIAAAAIAIVLVMRSRRTKKRR